MEAEAGKEAPKRLVAGKEAHISIFHIIILYICINVDRHVFVNR
jgi:hypothetical protein